MSKRRVPNKKSNAIPRPSTAEDALALDLAVHVTAPYRGEATHEDTGRIIVPLRSLVPDPENARLHDDKNLRHIRASLRRRGQQTPINVDRSGRVLKGNGTLEAAKLEEWGYIWIVVSQLEGAEATGYAIADNASGLSSKWDFEQLADNIRGVNTALEGSGLEFTDEDFALDNSEMSPLLAAEWQPGEFTGDGNDPSTDPKNAPQVGDTVTSDPATLQREAVARETKPSDLDADDRADNAKSIAVTPNMRIVIDQGIERVRLISGDLSISEGKCIELICADYLAGAPSRDAALDEYEALTNRKLKDTPAATTDDDQNEGTTEAELDERADDARSTMNDDDDGEA